MILFLFYIASIFDLNASFRSKIGTLDLNLNRFELLNVDSE